MSLLQRNLIFILIFPSCFSHAEVDELTKLIAERLDHMKAVAAYKWQHGLPVEDLRREGIVIEAGIAAALSKGIKIPSSKRFFESQIEAAKVIQSCWFSRWKNTNKTEYYPPTSVTDLSSVIRPKLIKLGDRIASELSVITTDVNNFINHLAIDCLTNDAKKSIFTAIRNIEIYSSRLDQINDSGVLRIGTTGDYAPFSFSDDGSKFQGIDIDLARNLATYLGSQPTFIQTSWPTLIQDFQHGKFDIGMSGISITPERKEFALFSDPYHVGGKTPIAHCNDIESYQTLKQIDRAGVRVIVTPGGTNEKFLDSHIREATKVLHLDNREIFELIADGTADLMITDKIEVALQSRRHPKLCGLRNEKTFTYQEKGYLIPKEAELLKKVNSWLRKNKANGRLDRVFTRHLKVS